MAPDKHDQHADVRRLVMDAAIAIITTTGAETLSMREVARQAGVSHQAPYHYFKDRSGIFAAIAEEGFQTLAQAFRRVNTDPQQHKELIAKEGFQSYMQFATENTGHFRVMFRSDICGVSTHSETRIAADAAFDELLLMATSILGPSMGQDKILTFAIYLWAQAHGLATLLLDGPLQSKLSTGAVPPNIEQSVISVASQLVSLYTDEMSAI